ncbi:hypothetical protein [Streptomyces sp. NPDC059783]|uniref:DUF7639 domain-containing protein n=1 Tax=Streptomyces sp. NPDC059783 TaxID=3346944 RepID=UPI00365C2D13
MDLKDRPPRILVAGPGGLDRLPFGETETVRQEDYDAALTYFEERAHRIAERATRVPADGPEGARAPALHLRHSYPNKPAPQPGRLGLRHDHPAPITVGDTDYPSVAHAYWALSITEPGTRHAVATAESAAEARRPAAEAPRREDREHVRTGHRAGPDVNAEGISRSTGRGTPARIPHRKV